MPKHVGNALNFDIYILTCAIRDRETFLDGCKPHSWSVIDEPTQKAIDETSAELKVMRHKRDALLAKQKEQHDNL